MEKDLRFNTVIKGIIEDTQSSALMLAMSNSIVAEEILKEVITQNGFKCVVTEFGGNEENFKRKVVSAVVGACLNKGLIEKDSVAIHAVIHATGEAINGFLLNSGMSTNIALKIAIVRDKRWVSVAFVGYSALHYSTNHKRAGVGTMHLI